MQPRSQQHDRQQVWLKVNVPVESKYNDPIGCTQSCRSEQDQHGLPWHQQRQVSLRYTPIEVVGPSRATFP